jgi:hypothetical protein
MNETNASLEIPDVTLADHGARFRCTVSNSLGTAVSREAVLSVHPETQAPVVLNLTPPANGIVRQLRQVEVLFSEGVTGVDAADLLVDGVAATNVAGVGPGPYIFQFPPLPGRTIRFAWAATHGITDLSLSANPFQGEDWLVDQDPEAPQPDLVINEILACGAPPAGLRDEDSEEQGWIEIHNRGSELANLAGWSLTDDPAEAGKWVFPSVTLAAGQYLVVFASGKDRRAPLPGKKLHTNFKLNIRGEYLGLFAPESPRRVVNEFSPAYPEQRINHSYGLNPEGVWSYYDSPTPGTANPDSTVTEMAEAVQFSVDSGVLLHPLTVFLSTPTAGAQIRYTLDGSEPTADTGLEYTGGVQVAKSSVVRAAAFKAGCLPSRTGTRTFLLNLKAAQQSLPILSLVTATNHLYGPTGILGIKGGSYVNGAWKATQTGDYHNPSKHGLAWERPVVVEYLPLGGQEGFRADCGLRVHSSEWFRPRLQAKSKFSFRLYFRGDYGQAKLNYPLFPECFVDQFDQVVLRAGNNDPTNPFIIDELIRRLSADTGQPASHGTFVNVFINGEYKGYYNPTERIDKNFCHAWHGGGEDWDVISQGSAAQDGTQAAWNSLSKFVSTNNLALAGPYQELTRRLDVTNFIDYLLVNIYASTADWPQNNWRAGRERTPDALFRFYIWDAEHGFGLYDMGRVSRNLFKNELAGSSEIPTLYKAMRKQPEFRRLFADRVHRHFFNNGALTDAHVLARYNQFKTNLLGVISKMNTNIPGTWIPRRRGYVMQHFEAEGMLTSSNAPVFNQQGGWVVAPFNLTLTAPTGMVYFTLNGEDPRVPFTDEPMAAARVYTNGTPILLTASAWIRARTRDGTRWSALNEARFEVAEFGLPLRITEIMPDPPGGAAYEYVELHNASDAAVDVSGVRVQGLDFQFPVGTVLPPRAVVVLGSDQDPAAFARRYPGLVPWDHFHGSLSNDGETLRLFDAEGHVIQVVPYGQRTGWPLSDGNPGYSLEIRDLNATAQFPADWVPSEVLGGSPGVFSPHPRIPSVRINEICAVGGPSTSPALHLADWIEIHNAGQFAVELAGWSLADEKDSRRFIFPRETRLEPGGFLVVFGDNSAVASPLVCPFALDRQGDGVFLFNSQGERVDAVNFGQQIPDHTLGRFDDAILGWALALATPGAPNQKAQVASRTRLRLNEWLSWPETSQPAWIELWNSDTNLPAPLSEVRLVHGSFSETLNPLAFTAAGGFIRLWLDDEVGPQHLNLTCAPAAGSFQLYHPSGRIIDRVDYASAQPGISEGRFPDGDPVTTRFPDTATPGAPNEVVLGDGPVFNELLAAPVVSTAGSDLPAKAWVELFNPKTKDLDLSTMELRLGPGSVSRWSFPRGTLLRSKAYLVIQCDHGQPPSSDGLSPAGLNSGLNLSPSGGTLGLYSRQNELLDQVVYGLQVPGGSLGWLQPGWRLLIHPTPGSVNTSPAVLGNPRALRINEWLASPGSGVDWIELFNPGSQPVELSGLTLTDDPTIGGVTKFAFGPASFIGPQAWLVLPADKQVSNGILRLGFQLNSQGESLRLYDALTNLVDAVDFGPQTQGISQGRWPDGSGTVLAFPFGPSPAQANAGDWDADGLPDAWELQYRLDPRDPADAPADADLDGLSNRLEWDAGTDPADVNSTLALRMQPPLNGQVEFQFFAPANRTLRLEYSGPLVGHTWSLAKEWPAQSYPQWIAHSLSVNTADPSRFYRLRCVSPAP